MGCLNIKTRNMRRGALELCGMTCKDCTCSENWPNEAKIGLFLRRIRKWNFADRTARTVHARWSCRLIEWKPWFRIVPWHSVGRPVKRWNDAVCELAGGSWTDAAKDKDLWQLLSYKFASEL